MLKLLCTVALLFVAVKANDEKTIPYAFFGSRTTYKTVSSLHIDVPAGYTPRQIFMLTRHGTRSPKIGLSQDLLPKLIKYQTKITESAKMCEKDIKAIKNWVTTIDSTKNRQLIQKGRDEMKELAIRVREAFPNLFERQYDSKIYEVLTLPYRRCKLSGQSFIQNVFKDETIPEIPKCDYTDILLVLDGMMEADTKFEEIRKYYQNQTKEFETGTHMTGVVQRVAAKLGIDSKELDPETITTMYEVSAYEYAIDESRIPPWYNVFCQEDLEILEYAWDLYWYYVIGYGNPHNAKLACPMAIRLEERLRKKTNEEGPDAVFYFACEKNIMTMLFILGLGDGDAPFTASNYKGMKDLNWRTSFYGPWAANFMAVLFEKADNDYEVAFYFNENLTPITLKDGTKCTYCPWLNIQEKLTAFITDNDCVSFIAEYNNKTA
ncbi:multiple inositol polyphosphate phosphatase 1-like [Adelges cooleyi]|uniref:multiple inositol polyphosphate phosphatase 1-like n=1 Tax=Adelges cooleyi TaxID=133065 RepID=UPI00217FF865|nr:multiple inositol polyphosphate phosphatase 1-like [Adelges cooleyi]XP_050421707.1 multiple inositol polyphosphate phosphatase 1-like [Adelges cooleyi]XP_050421718.1 multiple inositol polyphosphate phosphatase 1-like [Adelges cooleyi]XP_050421727.1 multiple inositol polyphosphate phosphatase 1-like [Adelges cooleyi]